MSDPRFVIRDGPNNWNTLFRTNILVDTKALGDANVAGDDSTGHLGTPNPYYSKNNVSATIPGYELHNTPEARNFMRGLQMTLRGYEYDVRFTNGLRTWIPMPTPNTLPFIDGPLPNH